MAQVSGEWLAVSEISTAKIDFQSQMIKDKRFLILEVGLRSFSMYLCVKRVNVITNKYETLWNRKNRSKRETSFFRTSRLILKGKPKNS